MKLLTAGPIAAAYIATVVLANVLTKHYGTVPIGFGFTATAGTFAAGAALLARNVTQDATARPGGHGWRKAVRDKLPIVGLMLAGCALSWVLADATLAIASAAAFACSETADMAVYTPLRRRNWSRAVLAASAAGAIVDTFLFLRLAHFPITAESVTGQLVVKVGMSWATVALVGVARGVLRESNLNAERA